MKRCLIITGYFLLVLAGLIIAAVIQPWPLVWAVGFPMAYAGALGIVKEIRQP